MQRIDTRAQLVALAGKLGVRPDWHEPDNQDVLATVEGQSFDNAFPAGEAYGGWDPNDGGPRSELHVKLHHIDDEASRAAGDYVPSEVFAVVNLANLFAWASGHQVPDSASELRVRMKVMLHDAIVRRDEIANHIAHHGSNPIDDVEIAHVSGKVKVLCELLNGSAGDEGC